MSFEIFWGGGEMDALELSQRGGWVDCVFL